MNLWYIKKKMVAPAISFEKGDVYLVSNQMQESIIKTLIPKGLLPHFEILDINKTILQYFDGDPHNILIIRSGGIGDIIALSSLVEQVKTDKKKIYFATQSNYAAVLKWFEIDVEYMDYSMPLFHGWTKHSIPEKQKVLRRFFCEDIIEDGASQNWYEIFFNQIGIPNMNCESGRPFLKTHRLFPRNVRRSNIKANKKSILLCPRASSNMRSMSFKDMYEPVSRCTEELDNRDVNLYVHRDVLTQADLLFIDNLDDSRIKIIQALDTEEYLLDLFDVDLTVSVDTGAIHFREGIEKPGIGIYAAFSTECRTKHYTFTHSFNVRSTCNMQPCYIHEVAQGQVCMKAEIGSNCAPCLSTILTKDLHEQIYDGIRTDLISALNG